MSTAAIQEKPKSRVIRIQPKTRPDGKLPYPYFISEDGSVGRQDVWRGSPQKLVGFNGTPANETVEPACGLEDFLADPKIAIGKYPIFKHKDGKWFTYQDPIESISTD